MTGGSASPNRVSTTQPRSSVATRWTALVIGAAMLTAGLTTIVAATLVQSDKEAMLFESTVERAESVRGEVDQLVALTEAELRTVALAGEDGRLFDVPRLVSGHIEALVCLRDDEVLVRAAAEPEAAALLAGSARDQRIALVAPSRLIVTIHDGDLEVAALLDLSHAVRAPAGWIVTLGPAEDVHHVTARRVEREGESRLVAVAPGDPTVTVDAPLAPAQRAASQVTQRVLAYSLAALVPICLVAWWLSRRLTIPIVTLAAAVRARGREAFTPPRLPDDEIGDLGHAIAAMSQGLARDARELRRAVELAREVARLGGPDAIRTALVQALRECIPGATWTVLGAGERPPGGLGISPAELEQRFASSRAEDSTRPPGLRTSEVRPDESSDERFVTSLFGARTCQAVVVGRGTLTEHDRSIAQLLGRIAQGALRTTEVVRDALENEKLAVLGRLSAGVAHEVNNPLSFILANVQLLENELGGELKEAATDARLGVERVARIVRDLGSLSRGGTRLDLEDVSLGALAQRAVKTVRARRPEVAVVLETVEEVSARCDAGRIEQIVVNLLSNAVDAARGAQAPRVVLELVHDEAMARFVVRDNGTGIAPGAEARLFEPFFSTKGNEGTGLGLYVSRALARSHGGDVRVVGSGPNGTTMELTLPVVAARESTDVRGRALPTRPRVLVVDDEPAHTHALSDVLMDHADVRCATTPDGAVQAVAADDFDLVLLDFDLTAMSSHVLAAHLAAIRPTLSSRIRMMSAAARDALLHAPSGQALRGLLSGPFNPD